MTNGELMSILGGGCGITSVAAIYLWRALIAAKQLHSDSSLKQSINHNLKESFDILEAQLKRCQEINQELHDDILTLTAQRDRANAKISLLEAHVRSLRQAHMLVQAQQEYLVQLVEFLKEPDNAGRIPPMPNFFCPITLETTHDAS